MSSPTEGDLQAVAEAFALQLIRGGLQRMPARVLATLLFSTADTITAREIAAQLNASPGTISTTIRTLDRSGLIERVAAPNSRREHFRFPADGWVRLMSTQNETLAHMHAAAQEGLAAVPADSYAGQRLTDMARFYAYLADEMPAFLERWKAEAKPTSTDNEGTNLSQ